MKRHLLMLLAGLSFVSAYAQADREDSVDVFTYPRLTIGVDVLQLLDNYPAFLPYLEAQGKGDFAFLQELGPVLQAESYDMASIDQYFGIKSRSEFKLYFDVNPAKKARSWLGLDVQMQFDRYEDDFWLDRGAFNQQIRSHAWRTVYAMHLRIGTQRILANDQVILSGSYGIGRGGININYADGEGEFEDFFLDEFAPLSPLSMNFRLQIGFSLK